MYPFILLVIIIVGSAHKYRLGKNYATEKYRPLGRRNITFKTHRGILFVFKIS